MSNTILQKAVKAALFAATGLVSGHAAAATLDQALVQAWQNNPTLESERQTLAAAQDRVDEAKGGYYPQVKLFGGVGTSHNDVTFMPLGPISFNINEFSLNSREVGLEVDQALYAG